MYFIVMKKSNVRSESNTRKPDKKNKDVTDRLVRSVCEGNERDYEKIMAMYEGKLKRWVSGFIRDPYVVEEVVQDTFLKAFVALPSFDFKYSFSTWIFRIARNCCVDRLRMKYPCPVGNGSDFDYEPSALDSMIHAEMLDELRKRLDSLPEIYAEIMRLRYRMDYSCAEICEITGLDSSVVRSRMYVARKLLAENLNFGS
jgi:RNA polymerase sigma-70 factor (ECF subfamily)